jgi:regulator of RNase E activity RraA
VTDRRPSSSADLLDRCGRVATSTWSDALDRIGIDGVLTGLTLRAGRLPMVGPAATVLEEVGPFGSASPERFGIDLILDGAQPGQIVLIAQRGEPQASAIGGLAALAAQRHGIAGIVVDGAVRDVDELEEVGLPIMSRTTTPASGRGRAAIAGVNVPLRIGSVEVQPGDLVVADSTGIVVLPFARIDELLPLAEERARSDEDQAGRLRSAADAP